MLAQRLWYLGATSFQIFIVLFLYSFGSKYAKNPENNQVLVVSSKAKTWSGRQKKEKIAKFIRKEIEKEFNKNRK